MEINEKRWVFLDTETTGKCSESGQPAHKGHRVIDIGAVEVLDRRFTNHNFQVYINPEQKIDEEAVTVHGLTDEFVKDKPLFKEIAQDFIDFVSGSVLIIHNAKFDVGFLNQELELAGYSQKIEDLCQVVDSYSEARKLRPGHARYSLDALCAIFNIDNSNRAIHGALLDANLLAEVYLAMTGGQNKMNLDTYAMDNASGGREIAHKKLKVIKASPKECEEHIQKLNNMMKKGKVDNWRTYYSN